MFGNSEDKIRRIAREEADSIIESKIRAIVKEEVSTSLDDTLKRFLNTLGVDADRVHCLQRNMMFLDGLRRSSEESSKVLKKSIYSLGVGGLGIAIWEGIKIPIKQ